jgi:hypothetical protein
MLCGVSAVDMIDPLFSRFRSIRCSATDAVMALKAVAADAGGASIGGVVKAE